MQPQDVTVAKGNKVDLSIDARGPGRTMFTYQWKKVGSDSLPDTASGGNTAQLTITSISPSDSGMYYCIVMNQWGNMVQSDNATVNVLCKLMCTVSIFKYMGKVLWDANFFVDFVVNSHAFVLWCLIYL